MRDKLFKCILHITLMLIAGAKVAHAADPAAPVTSQPPANPPATSAPPATLGAPTSPTPAAPTSAPTPVASIPAPAPANNPPGSLSIANSPAPPRLVNTGPTPADVAQFQAWLNGDSATGTPPSGPSTTMTTTTTKKVVISKPVKYIRPPADPNSPVIPAAPMSYEAAQKVMLESAPESPPPSADSKAAFAGMMQQNMPLTPQQVVRLRQLIDTSQRAASIPANIPPKPVSSTLMINLAPGATPPAIRLSQGYISSLVFVDSAGSPWPIAAYYLGDAKGSQIQWDGKSNTLLVQAVTPYGDSNLVVRLIGLDTPVSLELVSGQRVVDYRTDIHVPGAGPNSKDLPAGTGLPDSANQLLLSVLDGVAPGGSKLLTVTGGDGQAWLVGDRMYLRTRLTLLSPGWVGKMSSPDGMNAYEIQRTSTVLVSQYGNPLELKVEGF